MVSVFLGVFRYMFHMYRLRSHLGTLLTGTGYRPDHLLQIHGKRQGQLGVEVEEVLTL